MTYLDESTSLGRFRAAIARRLGLSINGVTPEHLAEILDRRIAAGGGGGGGGEAAYLDSIEGDALARDEIRALAGELTVAETYFFRHFEQFRVFAEVALPDRLTARTSPAPLRILSAGCASGEEAYSLSIMALESAPGPACGVSIQAVDVNPSMLEKASRASYSAWSLRETPDEIKRRWFHAHGREVTVAQAAREAVIFGERNLAADEPDLWQREAFDVVFCRNVMMYFTPDVVRRLVGRITMSLAPGGYLFLGHAETLRGLSQDFHLRHTEGTFFYQRKDRVARASAPVGSEGVARRVSPAPWPGAGRPVAWPEAVRRASERVHALSASARAAEAAGPVLATDAPKGSGLVVALDLLKEERFSEALAILDEGGPDVIDDPDVSLLRSVLLAQDGQLAAAEEACRRLLELDGMSAGAHYVLGLCREHAGDRQRALDHHQVAAHLDPTFAMPRLHLGLMARRAGDGPVARRELACAIQLLEREEPSRLLLFGGGFSRDALIALCRGEAGRAERHA